MWTWPYFSPVITSYSSLPGILPSSPIADLTFLERTTRLLSSGCSYLLFALPRSSPPPTSHITALATSSGLFANVISVESSLTTLVKSTSPPSFPLSSFSYHLTYCLLSFFFYFLPRCKLNVGRASVSFIHCCVPRRMLDS